MSSLLDILHRRDGGPDRAERPEPAAEPAAQTVELRLAVDNGPAEPADGPAPEEPGDLQPGPEPVPLPASEPATRVLTARHLQQRSRRSTILLGAGLCTIVVGAALATWLLNETSGLATGNDSLFTAPAGSTAFTPGATAGVVARPVPVPDRPGPEAAPVPAEPAPTAGRTQAAEPVSDDTTWFDMPAIEDATSVSVSASEPIRITRGTTTNPLFPRLSEAWTAFQAADFARAEALYREVRAADPGNVDALLGLGALAVRANRTAEARELYQAVLLAEPRNATAISAMSTLPAAGDRNLDESALKSLLRDQPGAANLHFALGLQYVAQGRWPDAQVAFFDALRNEPANADYAYNLAVSLDQLGQPGPAAAYYQRALELATASSLFNAGAAAERLATLRSAAP